jgi:glycosyltransferase involved in cell wall biosynthesis
LLEKPKILLHDPSTNCLQKPFITVGIPAFNEEQSIAKIVLQAQKFSDKVIVCDDGSTDMTAEIAQRLGAEVVKHKKNLGYGAALKSLFNKALEFCTDILVTLDGDGQHTASEIPTVIEPIINGSSDVVISSRFIDKKGAAEMPRYRKIGAKLITKLFNGSSKKGISDSQSGFRAYSREALERLSISEVGMAASIQILLEASRNNLRISEVAGTCKYKVDNVLTSKENPLTQGFGIISSIIKFVVEERPLIVLGCPGIASLIIGTFFGVWLLNIYGSAHHIVTNMALASIGFLFLGCFLISTSITLYAISRISKTK